MRLNKNSIAYLILVALIAGTAFLSISMFVGERTDRDRVDIHDFPLKLGAWEGSDLEITEKEQEILETKNLISRRYTNPEGENIYLFIIYSETNRSVFHPPEVCLLGSGANIVNNTSEKIDAEKLDFLASKLILEKNGYKSIALSTYTAGRVYTSSYYRQQIHFALNQLLGKGRRGGAMIRVTTQVRGTEKAALGRLKQFMERSIEILEELS